MLGAAYARLVRIDKGVGLLGESIDHGDRLGLRASNSLWVIFLGEAYLLAGRRGEALAAARRALAACRGRSEGTRSWALRLLAEIDASGDHPNSDAATPRYAEALALAQERVMRPLAACCQFELGRLYARIGNQAEAKAYLSIGSAAFRALDIGRPGGDMAVERNDHE